MNDCNGYDQVGRPLSIILYFSFFQIRLVKAISGEDLRKINESIIERPFNRKYQK
jgi:hypothetical protein